MDQDEFIDREWELIGVAKLTLKILAKVMADRDPLEVIKDPDLAERIGDRTLAEAREDEALAALIDARTTPDLPGLNRTEETLVIGQLGPLIFEKLLEDI